MDKPRMTEGQLRRARKLIRRLCANYDEGNCLALDEGEGCVCVQSISYSLLCRYFKEAVLPADAELCAAIGQVASGLEGLAAGAAAFQLISSLADGRTQLRVRRQDRLLKIPAEKQPGLVLSPLRRL